MTHRSISSTGIVHATSPLRRPASNQTDWPCSPCWCRRSRATRTATDIWSALCTSWGVCARPKRAPKLSSASISSDSFRVSDLCHLELWYHVKCTTGPIIVLYALTNHAHDIAANRWRFATYEGSLTTPPLSEVVHWLVFLNPIECSSSQVDQFRRLTCGDEQKDSHLFHNCRPIQTTNGRLVSIWSHHWLTRRELGANEQTYCSQVTLPHKTQKGRLGMRSTKWQVNVRLWPNQTRTRTLITDLDLISYHLISKWTQTDKTNASSFVPSHYLI